MAATPVIFHFQPTEIRVLKTPEELKEWERMMKEDVGLKGQIVSPTGSCTESVCGGRKDDCDQD